MASAPHGNADPHSFPFGADLCSVQQSGDFQQVVYAAHTVRRVWHAYQRVFDPGIHQGDPYGAGGSGGHRRLFFFCNYVQDHHAHL